MNEHSIETFKCESYDKVIIKIYDLIEKYKEYSVPLIKQYNIIIHMNIFTHIDNLYSFKLNLPDKIYCLNSDNISILPPEYDPTGLEYSKYTVNHIKNFSLILHFNFINNNNNSIDDNDKELQIQAIVYDDDYL